MNQRGKNRVFVIDEETRTGSSNKSKVIGKGNKGEVRRWRTKKEDVCV